MGAHTCSWAHSSHRASMLLLPSSLALHLLKNHQRLPGTLGHPHPLSPTELPLRPEAGPVAEGGGSQWAWIIKCTSSSHHSSQTITKWDPAQTTWLLWPLHVPSSLTQREVHSGLLGKDEDPRKVTSCPHIRAFPWVVLDSDVARGSWGCVLQWLGGQARSR